MLELTMSSSSSCSSSSSVWSRFQYVNNSSTTCVAVLDNHFSQRCSIPQQRTQRTTHPQLLPRL